MFPEENNIIKKNKYLIIKTRKMKSARSLCNFLKNIDWGSEDSKISAEKFLKNYENEPIDLPQTLSLWSSDYSFTPEIQEFNLKMLKKSSDETILFYLLQLVTAVKANKDFNLTDYLIDRCSANEILGNVFFWHMIVELERDVSSRLLQKFLVNLVKYENGQSIKMIFKKQGSLIETLMKISISIRELNTNIMGKRKYLETLLGQIQDEIITEPFPLPIQNSNMITGIIPEDCTVFQSQMNPILLTFKTLGSEKLKYIFKSGDDLRQDTLICQIIRIMNDILVKKKINSHLIIYQVVSTGMQHGFIEYVESDSLGDILLRPGGLATILKSNGTFDNEKMDRFIKSTACYSILTYLLCVGDRHLDNIMMTPQGSLFHIDYGFIGRDPKPFPPPMKLCPEMIKIMGGKHSEYYSKFLEHAIKCFLTLRQNSDIILDSISLMCDNGLNDINETLLKKMKKRFLFSLTDADVAPLLTLQIEKSFENVLPKMMDNFHHTWKTVSNVLSAF